MNDIFFLQEILSSMVSSYKIEACHSVLAEYQHGRQENAGCIFVLLVKGATRCPREYFPPFGYRVEEGFHRKVEVQFKTFRD